MPETVRSKRTVLMSKAVRAMIQQTVYEPSLPLKKDSGWRKKNRRRETMQ